MATLTSNMQQQGAPEASYVIKSKTMSIPFETLIVQKESPVDFTSLKEYKVGMKAWVNAKKLSGYFRMLNVPTYENLVKDFWVRAEVYNLEAARLEERQAVSRDSSLKGKTREQMGLKPFNGLEIRSTVMGVTPYFY
jgi:hypothetical protein